MVTKSDTFEGNTLLWFHYFMVQFAQLPRIESKSKEYTQIPNA